MRSHLDKRIPTPTPPMHTERQTDERAAEYSAASKYLNSGSARTALLTNRVQPIDISWVKEQWKRSFISSERKYFGEVIHGRGWILGEFRWYYPVVIRYNHGLPIYESVGEGLARVHLVSGGYEALNVPSDPDFASSYDDLLASDEEYVKVAQAIKRLTGESS